MSKSFSLALCFVFVGVILVLATSWPPPIRYGDEVTLRPVLKATWSGSQYTLLTEWPDDRRLNLVRLEARQRGDITVFADVPEGGEMYAKFNREEGSEKFAVGEIHVRSGDFSDVLIGP